MSARFHARTQFVSIENAKRPIVGAGKRRRRLGINHVWCFAIGAVAGGFVGLLA